jgi:hypothetical protein
MEFLCNSMKTLKVSSESVSGDSQGGRVGAEGGTEEGCSNGMKEEGLRVGGGGVLEWDGE